MKSSEKPNYLTFLKFYEILREAKLFNILSKCCMNKYFYSCKMAVGANAGTPVNTVCGPVM